MPKTPKSQINWLQISVLRVARVHFYYALAAVAYVMVLDGWKVITPQDVLRRWEVLAGLVVINTIVWYGARAQAKTSLYYQSLAYAIILYDIFLASFWIYSERGMASRGVALFAIPIAVSMILNSRSALYATALLSVAAYSLAAVKYFVDFFNEGFRIELYAVISFYSACFFVLAGILWVVLRSHGPSE